MCSMGELQPLIAKRCLRISTLIHALNQLTQQDQNLEITAQFRHNH